MRIKSARKCLLQTSTHEIHFHGSNRVTRCAYIFLDESGNFDFSANGTRYFILTSISMRRPFLAIGPVDAYRHECLEIGLDLESFHCAKDNRRVRERVFELIAAHLDAMLIDCLVIEKSKATVPLREGERLYPRMLGYLLRFVVRKELDRGAEEFVVITDTLPFIGKRRTAAVVVQRTLARMLPEGTRLQAFHHASCSHYGLQLADYCCWAMFRKWERGDVSHHDRIHSALRSEFDIFGGK